MPDETKFIFHLIDDGRTGGGDDGQGRPSVDPSYVSDQERPPRHSDRRQQVPAGMGEVQKAPQSAPRSVVSGEERPASEPRSARGEQGRAKDLTWEERIARAEEDRKSRLDRQEVEKQAAASLHEGVPPREPEEGEVVEKETKRRDDQEKERNRKFTASLNANVVRAMKAREREAAKLSRVEESEISKLRVEGDRAYSTELQGILGEKARAAKKSEADKVKEDKARQVNQEKQFRVDKRDRDNLVSAAASAVPGGRVLSSIARSSGPLAAVGVASAALGAVRAADPDRRGRVQDLRRLSGEVATAAAMGEVASLMVDLRAAEKHGAIIAQSHMANVRLELANRALMDSFSASIAPDVIAVKGLLTRINEGSGKVIDALSEGTDKAFGRTPLELRFPIFSTLRKLNDWLDNQLGKDDIEGYKDFLTVDQSPPGDFPEIMGKSVEEFQGVVERDHRSGILNLR